jgi:hypothetical protein
MLIRVRYVNDTYDMLKAWRLQEYLDDGRVVAFLRSDGWAVVGRDSLRRSMGRGYPGPERRRIENNLHRAA